MAKIKEQRELENAANEHEKEPMQKQQEDAKPDHVDEKIAAPRQTTRAKATIQPGSEQVDFPRKTKPSAADTAKKATKRTKGKKNEALGIADFFNKRDVNAESESNSVAAALEQAADKEAAQPTPLGTQLRSARQPELMTGGVMRSYQLEGLEWLKSLYENGLNGILADEMGLGKTIQTISFLAFLRSKKTYGPFLIAAPLSTLNNWVDELALWTPDIPVVLYHGSKEQREEIRHKKLVRPGSAEFPVVCTSYEICMNDRKYLAGYNWKFIVIVSNPLIRWAAFRA